MKTLPLFLFMCLALVGVAAEPAPQTKPLFPATVTCFNGKIDLGTSCWMTWSDGPAPDPKSRVLSRGLTCGSAGQVSEISWEFLGSENGADLYQFTRHFPVDSPTSETVTKQIRFRGKRLIIFEDKYQVVVIQPPTNLENGKKEPDLLSGLNHRTSRALASVA